jgi:hypothetical protein
MHDMPLGNKNTAFRSQKLARENAAMEAMAWLRENLSSTEDGRPAEKKALDDLDSITPWKYPKASTEDSPSSEGSYGKRVHGQ